MEYQHIITIITQVLAFIVAIVGHEIMHGLVAYKNGDHTAYLQGRLKINPLVHIDPIGSVILPAVLYFSGAPFLFGWARPVPINTRTVIQNGGINAAIAVSLAGITYNILLATISLGGLMYLNNLEIFTPSIFLFAIGQFLVWSMIYNIVLAIFNLYPIPPLDGSRALMYFSSKQGWYNLSNKIMSLERYGMFIVFALIALPVVSDYFFAPILYVIKLFLSFLG